MTTWGAKVVVYIMQHVRIIAAGSEMDVIGVQGHVAARLQQCRRPIGLFCSGQLGLAVAPQAREWGPSGGPSLVQIL